ncbi:cob(I)yrinic acid a,c-diamide adenosyltransferase [Tuwongella immobilis]|uniref:Corrinoid adenosyltransferase n=1 Tax=Tuwongella immobilis TaxID=692036 RepID=A0A6C2YS35_9BACT|nr:cob(I)yrinic acid a,c-diamide adenosyltransferase [Tuwongella immobilis]VIP04478.1 cob yrinic acid -diamide adenosyltransferase : ATP/cobalamin adenosyltransferase OS=Rhodopseudomonas palustris (strain DX-1) GN=Rpdx1_4928 PE=4 SV=1: Cob_adeno_trans [Tuwongella immobilis]VTS06318.1 cob yrinic acid -diamide adenosyltransferase : ATP/cobalamin adenosyltransferase OS=Rhodopseudomonas palustris (strain DX-1) GN=Rpdx1_4928 PE=4 SV=1: Cob_adeno_trans [Tuwongella immobilis]
MVYLSRIYTKTGDSGQTSLGDGSRRPKHDGRVAAYGEVDELNSVLGLLLAMVPDYPEASFITRIQHDLFDLGADLCIPLPDGDAPESPGMLRIVPEQVTALEQTIDRLNDTLQPLRSFILPGGTPAAAWLHLARTVCRRAERSLTALQEHERINPQALMYLNRLSDLLFVMGRAANQGGQADILWVPGQNRSAPQ